MACRQSGDASEEAGETLTERKRADEIRSVRRVVGLVWAFSCHQHVSAWKRRRVYMDERKGVGIGVKVREDSR